MVASALLLVAVADFALSKIVPASPTATQTPIFFATDSQAVPSTFHTVALEGAAALNVLRPALMQATTKE